MACKASPSHATCKRACNRSTTRRTCGVAILVVTTMRARTVLVSTSLCAALAGCGISTGASGATPTATPRAIACALTVVDTMRGVARRIYAEDAASASERIDLRLVLRSPALQAAALAGDPVAARAAARALIATGHVARLRLSVRGRVLADVGARPALAPVSGTLTDATGAPIGSVLVSVQGVHGYLAAASALVGSGVSLRSGARVVAGSSPVGRGVLPSDGLVRVGAATVAVASFAARAFPAGTLRVTLARSLASTASECGSTTSDTMRRAIGEAVMQIYATEAHGATLAQQALRVERDGQLLGAVAAHDPAGIRAAVIGLLNQHIVRVRVLAPGLAPVDVGGPYVLGPVTVALRQGGRAIGSAELSIQDDLGFVLLARRLTGVQVVVGLPPTPPVTPAEAQLIASSSQRVGGYRVVLRGGARPTMSTLPDAPATLPVHGTVSVDGRAYAVFSFTGEAFPSGPLPVWVLVPTS